ncbi:tyrosinase [Mycena metata]|uniref:tyrosinase n=1 Tax=Mycena metata TaxID=1033252 RepID=A0AAD7H3E9_9AGAR|nr:tyrosinase [Mycena metata]
MSKFIVTGAKGGSTQGAAAPNRIEINDFVKIEDKFSLYIQALQHIYGQQQPDVNSFFSMAGIHGLPYQPWDGAGDQPVDPTDPDAWQGYCTHGNVLFPTFHRPYVFLFEQVLQAAAINIAATYTVDQDRFKKAALELRQPYWDWAKNSVPPAEVISLAKVTIIAPNGQKTQVDNPLRRYTFHPIDPSFPDPYSGWPTTLRHPDSTDPDAQDNVAELTRTMKSVQRQLKTQTYNLLTRVHTWPAFSNHTPGDGGSTSNSLEAIHDGIHTDVGGNGQMSDPSVAAFDPIFFLHHCNVDRMLSLWSALNPGVWVTPGEATGGTWTIPPDTRVDKTTDLTPFWSSESAYWASSEVTATSSVGYTYPEFNGLNMNNPNAVRTAIAQKVNQLYGGSIFSSISAPSASPAISAAAKPAAVQASAHAAAAPAHSTPSAAPAPHVQANLAHVAEPHNGGAHVAVPHNSDTNIAVPHNAAERIIWDWTARIQVKKYEVGGSFSVLLFLGAVPDDPTQWRTSPNFVGAHHVFANSVPDRCANCRTHRDAEVEGFVHLDDGITDHSGLGSLEPNVVEPYLTHNLHWRVRKAGGEVVDLSSVPSLEVTVFATPLTLPPGSDFPVPGERRHHGGITHGRTGGSRNV